MNYVRYALIILCLFLCGEGSRAATTLLPNGKQCFAGVNGAYSSGSLNMFVPNTTTPKATWQDPNQSALNTQPIQLDANGCAIIYGVGQYRQQLFDGPVQGGVTTGNLIWDQLTTDTSAYNSVFWAGIAGGTPNVITITDPGFNGTDGSVVQFVALATNTGSTTLNPSGFGNVLIQKSTTAGPVSLIGGEIVAGNVISAVYSASSNTFQLLNAVIQSASGASAPLCGATGLKITNSASLPNTVITLSASQLVMETASGIVQSRNNVSLTAINISTGTTTSSPNGMDGESPGTSNWVYIYAIDNGAAPAGLVSLSSTAPTLPSGYNYKCRLAAMRVDGSGNLLRTLQLGAKVQYVVTPATNTANLPVMISGASGNVTTPTWTAVAVAGFVPPSATSLIGILSPGNPIATEVTMAAPNQNYGAYNSTSNPPPLVAASTTSNITYNIPFDFLLESTSVYYAASGTTPFLASLGWKDSVNAN